MRKLNLETLSNKNQARVSKYERFGVKVFLKALELQAVSNPSPEPMKEAYLEFYEYVFTDAAKFQFNQIRTMTQAKDFIPPDFFLATWKAYIRNWVVENMFVMVDLVNKNTFNKVQETLILAIEQGLNPFQTAKLLKDTIAKRSRALAIAVTESTRANNLGLKKSAEDWRNQTGTELWKPWVHGKSRRAREVHLGLQNKPIREDMNFIGISGLPMDIPGDQRGGAKNTVNCSCSVTYVSRAYMERFFPQYL